MSFKQFKVTLQFEDTAETNAFLQHYGIYISSSSPGITRDSFVEPENPPPIRRSPALVEAKLLTSVGEAVYGEPLPADPAAAPSSSFDERGYFIGIIKPPLEESLPSPVIETVKLPPLAEISNDVRNALMCYCVYLAAEYL